MPKFLGDIKGKIFGKIERVTVHYKNGKEEKFKKLIEMTDSQYILEDENGEKRIISNWFVCWIRIEPKSDK